MSGDKNNNGFCNLWITHTDRLVFLKIFYVLDCANTEDMRTWTANGKFAQNVCKHFKYNGKWEKEECLDLTNIK